MCLEKEKTRNNLEIKVDDLLEMWYDAVREAEEQDKLLAAYRDDSKNLGNTVLVKTGTQSRTLRLQHLASKET